MVTIEKIKNTFPVFTLLFISLGYVKLYSRYRYLGIDIVNYLDFSEILLLFIREIILGFFILLFIIFIYSVFMKWLHKRQKNRLNKLKKKNFFGRLWINFKEVSPFAIIAFLIYLFHLMYDNGYLIDHGEKAYRMHFGLYYAFQLLLYYCGLYLGLSEIEFKIDKINLNRKFQIKYVIIIYAISASFVLYYNESQSIKDMARGDKRINIVTDKLNLSTDKSMPYMGETRNYMFVYDKNNCQTIVIDKNEIMTLTYGFNERKVE